LAPVSDAAHMFHGSHAIYGPYRPGTLRNSIYQVFSKDNSFSDVSTYHISWNADKAPYGAMVEFGTSKAPAHSFIGRAVIETRAAVRAAIKQRYIDEVNSKL
jgi:HK97 gp10 family phage protein